MKPELPDKAPTKPRAFVTLDALRGIAAIAVVCVHLHVPAGSRELFPHGFLAVDFFFMLSGFVMTYVYQQRLETGWSGWSFLKARVLRLYPLYGLGVLLGALGNLLGAQLLGGQVPLRAFLEILAFSLLFLPSPATGFPATAPTASLYYFDFPGWSLLYELVANAVHAALLRRRSPRLLFLFCAICGIVLLAAALRFNTIDFGNMRASYRSGIFRVLFSYTAGILCYKVWSLGRGRVRLSPVLSAVTLLGVFLLPVVAKLNGLFEFLIVALLFPALLLAGASNQPPPRFLGLSRWLGGVSYPVYILHIPLLELFQAGQKELLQHGIVHTVPFPNLLFLSLLLPIATWLSELYDPEARKLLLRCVDAPKRLRKPQLAAK